MAAIRSKVPVHGDPKESSWPPARGTGGKGFFHIDKETSELKEGFPPPHEVYDKAPMFISDQMKAYVHPGTGIKTESKSELKRLDAASGCKTTDRIQPPDMTKRNQAAYAMEKDRKESLLKAVAQIDNGTAKMSEETRAKCIRENERVSNLLGFDAFNVVGRKKNERGKRYRRRK